MKRVLLSMRNFLFSDAIAEILLAGGFNVVRVEDPEEIVETGLWFSPCILMMEVSSKSPYKIKDRLKIGEELRKKNPMVKLVFVVDENADKEVAHRVKEAKIDGLIEQFIFGSISASYLTAILETI